MAEPLVGFAIGFRPIQYVQYQVRILLKKLNVKKILIVEYYKKLQGGYNVLRIFVPTLLLFVFNYTNAQVESNKKDNSKPTNVYSQIDNFIEFRTSPEFNIIGYNPRISYAPHENHAFILEVPLLYNLKYEKFGLGDVRFRYFGVAYRNYDNFFGSFGASLDVFAPTGKYENGLGSSSWRISPGLTFGFILNRAKTISVFPVLSYIYTSEPSSDKVPQELKEIDHGASVQLISSFVLSDDFFILITPILDFKDLEDEREDEFILEVEPVLDIMNDKFQAGVFYRGAFNSQSHTISLYFTVFI